MTVEAACSLLEKRHETGKDFSIVVVSEGYQAHPAPPARSGP